MQIRPRFSRPIVPLVACLLGASRPVVAQDLGNKLLGAVGANAGTQPPPGLYVLDRAVVYRARQLRDRDGNVLPIEALELDVAANVFGLSWTRALGRSSYFTAAFGAPLARVDLNAEHPQLAVDAAGFGDLFVQPVKLGARAGNLDGVLAYTIYAPTGRFEPRGLSVGRGFWTHQLSLGGAYHLDRTRRRVASLLASYDVNSRKRAIDIRRGNSVQVQGGAATQLVGPVDAGLAGFAFWQVTDSRGADLPDAVRGARTRAFGLGPEVGVVIPSLRARVDLRAEWEFGVRSRQDGRILVFGATFLACCPPPGR